MQALTRSKSAGVTGGRGTAGAGPGRDLLYIPVEIGEHVQEFKVKWSRTKRIYTELVKE